MYRRVAILMFVLLALTGFFSVKQSVAQASGAAFFQTIIVDPYSQALGEATVALRGYPGAASINPASIGRTNTVQFGSNLNLEGGGLFHTPWLPDILTDIWVVSPSVDVRFRRWAFAYQYKELNFGEAEYRDAQNNLLGTFQLRDRSHKIVAAFDVRPNLSVGVGLNLIRSGFLPVVIEPAQRIEDATTVSFDLGVVYGLDFDVPYARLKPSLGWSLTDFGRKIRYGDEERGDPLSMKMRGGLSLQAESDAQWLRRPIVTLGLHGGLSKSLVGVDEDDGFTPYGPFEALIKSWKPIEVRVNPFNEGFAEFKTLNAFDQLTTHTGLEVSLLKMVSLRWGGYHENKYLGARQYDTFGFGIDLYYLALDYSKTNTINSAFNQTTYWRLTARVPLSDSPDNFWPSLLRKLRR